MKAGQLSWIVWGAVFVMGVCLCLTGQYGLFVTVMPLLALSAYHLDGNSGGKL